MASVTVMAPAKLNFTLEVLGRRNDGYHTIQSFIQTIDIYDRISARIARSISLRVTGGVSVGPDEENLVMRAALLLNAESGGGHGADITLEKAIPVSAGLGGGSSDAAATLLALNDLWDLRLRTERLAALATKIGSDVPFFLYGGAAVVCGRGEIVTPARATGPATLLLVFSRTSRASKTAAAYSRVRPELYSDGGATTRLQLAANTDQPFDHGLLMNTFDALVSELYPEILPAWELCRGRSRRPHLAGSGPSFVVETTAEAEDEILSMELAERFGLSVMRIRTGGSGS